MPRASKSAIARDATRGLEIQEAAPLVELEKRSGVALEEWTDEDWEWAARVLARHFTTLSEHIVGVGTPLPDRVRRALAMADGLVDLYSPRLFQHFPEKPKVGRPRGEHAALYREALKRIDRIIEEEFTSTGSRPTMPKVVRDWAARLYPHKPASFRLNWTNTTVQRLRDVRKSLRKPVRE